MNLLIELAIATARDKSIHEVLAARNLATQERRPNAGGMWGPPSLEDAATNANETVVALSEKKLGKPHDGIREYYRDARIRLTESEAVEDFLAVVKGARQLRDQLDDLETTAARAARAQGVSVRKLANAAGVSERNAIKRYKQVPGERLTSHLPQ